MVLHEQAHTQKPNDEKLVSSSSRKLKRKQVVGKKITDKCQIGKQSRREGRAERTN